MAIRGDYLVLQLEQDTSTRAPGVLADTTSVNVDFTAEALETTSQDSGLAYSGIPGKVTATASGDFLIAASAANFDNLHAYMAAGTVFDFELFVDGGTTKYMSGDCFLTGLTMAGGNSDQLATGSYSLQLTGTIAK
jgi:hypothetical protein